MPLELSHGHAVVLIRQSAFERGGLTRQAIDERYNLTDDEFRVEDGLIGLGPLPSDDMLPDLIADLEERSDRTPVQSAIALRTRRPDSGAFAAVQHSELDHGEIGGPPHDSSQRIDFANDGPLCDASNGRVA